MKELRNSKILIDPGHSSDREGALSGDRKIGEHEVNKYQADVLFSLLSPNYYCKILDPIKDDLQAIGAQAASFDAFISLHCNSFDGRRNYTTVCIDPRYNKPTDANVRIASKAATAMASNLGIKPYAGPAWPLGIMPNNLVVLSAAHKAGCKICFLSEAFFIDWYFNADAIRKCSDSAMVALSQVLKKELK